MAPDKSVKAFNEGRGHAIERENYLADLYNPDRKLIGQARSATNKEDDGEEEEEDEEVDESSSAAAETWSGHGNGYNSPRPAYKQNDFNSYNRYNILSDMNDDINNNNGDINYAGRQQQQHGHQNHHNNSNTTCTTSNSGWLNCNSPYYKSFSMSTTNNFQKINDRDNNFGNSIHTNDITQKSFTGYKQKYTNTNSTYNAYNSNSRFQNNKHRYNNPNYNRHHHDTNQGTLHDDVTSDVNVIPPYSKKQRQF
ncbi:hypothetical protein HELRODRAFT_174929 [Helobdella robusta]|uniref:Uncharacterized protein n=1 Tax=Helobdella robusta TaxID=6412 RepID=T1F8M4_HELRO|nr:hypothetical protein HELRODRAFT_174929 [Helobdella robusta]ESO01374.1 hypothetical protein HELRODRAFT_174929 [Helobdella robusta]